MDRLYHQLLSVLILTYCSSVQAQIVLSGFACVGNAILGTATYTTDMVLPTGESQRIPAGDFWDQSGAVWVFSTDTPGVIFGWAGIPGAGAEDIPQADINALKIDDSSTAWTLSVPTPSVGEYDIVFGVTTPGSSSGTASVTAPPGITSTTGTASTASITSTNGTPSPTTTTNAAVAKRRRHRSFVAPLPLSINAQRRALDGAKVRRSTDTTAVPAGQYHLIIKGTYPCGNDPGLGLQPPPSQTGTSDPALVTACSQNSILPSSNVWSAYEVSLMAAFKDLILVDCHRRIAICRAFSLRQHLRLLILK